MPPLPSRAGSPGGLGRRRSERCGQGPDWARAPVPAAAASAGSGAPGGGDARAGGGALSSSRGFRRSYF